MLVVLVVVCGGIFFDWRQLEPWAEKIEAYVVPKHDATASAPSAPPAVPVTAAKATIGSFPVVLTGLGNVQAYNTVLVRTRVDGQIVKINFQEGQLVHQG